MLFGIINKMVNKLKPLSKENILQNQEDVIACAFSKTSKEYPNEKVFTWQWFRYFKRRLVSGQVNPERIRTELLFWRMKNYYLVRKNSAKVEKIVSILTKRKKEK